MITERMNPRRTVAIWLQQMTRSANSEKANYTRDMLVEFSEPILSMTAAAEAALPVKMKMLLESGTYPRKAIKYFEDNLILNTGLRELDDAGKPINWDFEGTDVARQALTALVERTSDEGYGDPLKVSRICDEIAMELSQKDNPMHKMHGEGTGILLREILGLPGDASFAETLTDERVIDNMRHAVCILQDQPEFQKRAEREIEPG